MSLKLGTTDISGVPTTLINTVNNKLDASTYTSNPRTNAVYITQTYHNGASWYRVWSDGFIEQGGKVDGTSAIQYNVPVSLIKNFSSTNYCIMTTVIFPLNSNYSSDTNTATYNGVMIHSGVVNTRSTSGFKISALRRDLVWYACGY